MNPSLPAQRFLDYSGLWENKKSNFYLYWFANLFLRFSATS